MRNMIEIICFEGSSGTGQTGSLFSFRRHSCYTLFQSCFVAVLEGWVFLSVLKALVLHAHFKRTVGGVKLLVDLGPIYF